MQAQHTFQRRSPTRLKPITWRAWYKSFPARLMAEQAAMRERFPGFALVGDDGGRLGWVGCLISNRGRRYKAFVQYPQNYPYAEPGAYILDPPFGRGVSSPHMLSGGRLCLFHPADDTWRTNTTCTQIVALVAAWIFAHETHAATCRKGVGGVPCSNDKCSCWPGKKA